MVSRIYEGRPKIFRGLTTRAPAESGAYRKAPQRISVARGEENPSTSHNPKGDKMKLTLKDLDNLHPCKDGRNWYVLQGQPDTVEATIAALLDSKISDRYVWANWLLSRVLSDDARVKYAIFWRTAKAIAREAWDTTKNTAEPEHARDAAYRQFINFGLALLGE